ncbi:MAG TPA: acyltransferase [Terracidiphilus sp.]|nr:acyltransferase [Terracidiphilus sp.]
MTKSDYIGPQRKFVSSLEGVRGYAFLLVFLAHVCGNLGHAAQSRYAVRVIEGIAFVSVPTFFVLSGYLICGILIDTRAREGYFKIFYSRRILRVFPLYYLTLLAVALFCALKSYSLNFGFWVHFLYIHNLLPNYQVGFSSPPGSLMVHLWSMGVEEQFYLIWPLVVWFCPNRRILFSVTFVLIAFSFALRFAAPWLRLTALDLNFWTPTRIDAILLGAVLAMIRGEKIYRWLERVAQYIALCGGGAIVVTAIVPGPSAYRTPLGAASMISLWNITAAALVVAVMREGSFLCRMCSGKGICWLGARSYGLYLFHYIYLEWLFKRLTPTIHRFIPLSCAQLVIGVCAFGLTVLLAGLCYRFIEEPAMNLKKKLKYGAARNQTMPQPPEPAYAKAD